MTTMLEAAAAFEKGKTQYEAIMKRDACDTFCISEQYGQDRASSNTIGFGDNLAYMEYLLKQKNMAGRIQLIYVDPPFFSKGKYQASFCLESEKLGKSSLIRAEAYDDRWEQGMPEYLSMLTVRLFMMKELLAESGCIWMHLDWHVAHYVKLLMDAVFGEKNFNNEVIWTYKSGGANQKSFARKHDTLLFYSKSSAYKFKALKEKSYNREYKPYRFKGVEEFCDETGWYTLVNMKDVWSIDMVGRTSSERTGYATQKPEKVLARIIESCSDDGDLCADFFAGSGSFGAVCQKLGRKWIMCDEGEISIGSQVKRLGKLDGCFAMEKSAPEPLKRNLDIRICNDKIELLRYWPDMEELLRKVPEKNRAEIEKYMQADSLSLISSWSVDDDFDGVVHRGKALMDGNVRCCEMKLQKGKRISISGYDVLGRTFLKIVDR